MSSDFSPHTPFWRVNSHAIVTLAGAHYEARGPLLELWVLKLHLAGA
jgi:hypothetical protein